MLQPAETFSTYTVNRPSAGTRINGVWADGADVIVTITACIQPATPEDLLRLPEGRREQASIIVFTTDALQTEDKANALNPDRIVYDGAEWEVADVEDFSKYGLEEAHYEAIAQRTT